MELFLNAKSLGGKPLPPDASPRTWTVRFEPGTLLAVAKNRGRVVARHELRTAGTAARIVLSADRTPRRAGVGRPRSLLLRRLLIRMVKSSDREQSYFF